MNGKRFFLDTNAIVQLLSGNTESNDGQLKERVLSFRRDKKLKFPDAVIAASSAIHACLLVTADKQLLKIPGLAVQGYQVV